MIDDMLLRKQLIFGGFWSRSLTSYPSGESLNFFSASENAILDVSGDVDIKNVQTFYLTPSSR